MSSTPHDKTSTFLQCRTSLLLSTDLLVCFWLELLVSSMQSRWLILSTFMCTPQLDPRLVPGLMLGASMSIWSYSCVSKSFNCTLNQQHRRHHYLCCRGAESTDDLALKCNEIIIAVTICTGWTAFLSIITCCWNRCRATPHSTDVNFLYPTIFFPFKVDVLQQIYIFLSLEWGIEQQRGGGGGVRGGCGVDLGLWGRIK